jgi:hypothetical protein
MDSIQDEIKEKEIKTWNQFIFEDNIVEKEIYSKNGGVIGYIRKIPSFTARTTIKGETYKENFHQIWNRFIMKRFRHNRIN